MTTIIPQDLTTPDTPAAPSMALAPSSAEPMPLDLPEDFQPPRLSLRALAFEALLIDATLEQTEGELTPELEQRLDTLGVALMLKADGVGDYLDALNAEVAVFKAEEQRLAERRKSIEKRAANFKQYVLTLMQRMDRPKIEGTYRKLAVNKTAGTVEVLNLDALPSRMKRTEVIVSPEKNVIKDEMKANKSDTLDRVHTVALSSSFDLVQDDVTRRYSIIETEPLLEDQPRTVATFAADDLVSDETREDGMRVVQYREVLARLVPGYTLKVS